MVPVLTFAERLDAFFHQGLFGAAPRPQQPTVAALARELRRTASALLRRLRCMPVHLQSAGAGLRGVSPWHLLRRGPKAAAASPEL